MREFILVIALLYGSSALAIGKIGITVRESDENGKTQVIISNVFAGGTADQAGLMTHDIILKFNGRVISSYLTFIQTIRAVDDTAFRPITILRAGRIITVGIKVYQAKTFLIHIVRESNLLNWVITPFEVHVSNEYLGDIDEDESRDFIATTESGDTATIYVKGTSPVTGETSVSNRYKIIVTDGYMPVATFKAEKTPVILRFSYKIIDPVTDHELAVYRKITADSSAAPKWFKRTVKKTLQDTAGEWRGKFFSSLIQCPLDMRLLAILGVLLPLFCFIRRKKIGFLLVCVACLYPATWIINTIVDWAIYGFGGEGRYIPFEFMFFCVLVIGMISYIGMLIYPFAIQVDEHKEKILIPWGIFGKMFAVIEILLAFIEIYHLIANITGHSGGE